MSDLINIRKHLEALPDNKLMLQEPISIKATEHISVFTCWGVGVSDQGVFLMDADQQWHGPLKTHQKNAGALISGLCSRLGITKIIS